MQPNALPRRCDAQLMYSIRREICATGALKVGQPLKPLRTQMAPKLQIGPRLVCKSQVCRDWRDQIFRCYFDFRRCALIMGWRQFAGLNWPAGRHFQFTGFWVCRLQVKGRVKWSGKTNYATLSWLKRSLLMLVKLVVGTQNNLWRDTLRLKDVELRVGG